MPAPAPPPRFFYSDHYTLDWGSHVFPTHKYRRIRERLLAVAAGLVESGVLEEGGP